MKRIRLEIGEWYFADEVDKRISELEALQTTTLKNAERHRNSVIALNSKVAEIERLTERRREIYADRIAELELSNEMYREAQGDFSKLSKQLAEAQKDAERYRWSIDNPVEYSQILFDCHHFGEDMQTAIDAAMEGGE